MSESQLLNCERCKKRTIHEVDGPSKRIAPQEINLSFVADDDPFMRHRVCVECRKNGNLSPVTTMEFTISDLREVSKQLEILRKCKEELDEYRKRRKDIEVAIRDIRQSVDASFAKLVEQLPSIPEQGRPQWWPQVTGESPRA